MKKVLSFLKPSPAKIFLFLIWLVIFYLVFTFLFKGCISADCRNFQGQLISCCSQAKTAAAYFLYNYRILLLVLTYLFSCWLSINLGNEGTISHQARQL